MDELTILCISLTEGGHTNATIGIASALRKKGHRIVFAADKSMKGTFSKHGFHEELYDENPAAERSTRRREIRKRISKLGESSCKLNLHSFSVIVDSIDIMLEQSKNINNRIKDIVETWKPNMTIDDRIIPMPALVTSTIPLIRLCSLNPLYIFDDERLPPPFTGLPLTNKKEWQQWRQKAKEMRSDYFSRFNEWLQKEDKSIPKIDISRTFLSRNLNIYVYPKSLVDDYLKLFPDPLAEESIYARLDYCMRESSGKFDMPTQLKNIPGKLIFVSMGTVASLMVGLMRKLVSIFANSNHKFIFAKGVNEETYELASNMWGEPYVPQLDILPHVDLVVFHGGNNTLVESLYFGKPVIILPLFSDQFDNAQRVVEKEIGLTFNPFTVSEYELNTAVENLLYDSNVDRKVKKISQEMRESNCMDKVINRVEYVAKNPKFPTITGI